MTIIHNNREWTVRVTETQAGQPPILFYECGREQLTQDKFEAMVLGDKHNKKKAHDYHELKYNGKVEAAGTRAICWAKKQELMKQGTHKKGVLIIE